MAARVMNVTQISRILSLVDYLLNCSLPLITGAIPCRRDA